MAGKMGVRPVDITGCAISRLGEIGFVLQNDAVCSPEFGQRRRYGGFGVDGLGSAGDRDRGKWNQMQRRRPQGSGGIRRDGVICSRVFHGYFRVSRLVYLVW